MSKVTGVTADLADDVLLRRMMAGGEEAFTALYRRRQSAVYRFALHMSGNAAVAEDVVQEVFMTLIRDAQRFDPSRGSLGGFLIGIARNHLRRRWERDRRTVPLLEESDSASFTFSGNGNGHHSGNVARADDRFATLDAIARVRGAISTLPENYREVVILCELQEMSYEEAAAALDCPIGTVRSRLHRARALLVGKLRSEQKQPARHAVASE
ncbi:MAG: RNA polymerase sigma factor [Candidatus Acidiferrales bacterium]